ncbi:MAG: glycoside hydrolase family 15 protein [Pseudomonas profundi]|uniref:glycoside hydrolase family 15 protein n=1 Tax=Pseudomonas profundi TaxID=1981513 RepID=UPI00300126AD
MPKPEMSDYPDIASLAAIGDGRSMALVGPDGNVEWFCPQRFDAAPLSWPLLDRQRGGRLQLSSPGADVRMRYLDETAVLEFEVQSVSGHARVRLCMEWLGSTDQQRLIWQIDGLDGRCEFTLLFEPRPDFGSADGEASLSIDGLTYVYARQQVLLQADCFLCPDGEGWTGTLSVSAGEQAGACLSVSLEDDMPARPLPLDAIPVQVAATVDAWRKWCATLDVPATHRTAIVRSAICLKLLIYAPTGAVVAAGTTSLPEHLGGERNWDYRFTWFRDAGLTLGALFGLGCRDEAHRWAQWMQQTIERHGTPLAVLYDVQGNAPPPERIIKGVHGYRGSPPVRVGNAADGQFQLDIYGELLECVSICDSMADDAMRSHWSHMRAAADFIAAHWHEPDQSIWEMRSAPRHYVHSKVMAWAGLQRALWLMRRHDLGGDEDNWVSQAESLRQLILQRGLSTDGSHFIRAFDDERLDASLLLLARVGFVDGRDARFVNTVDTIREQLGEGGGAIRRYPAEISDGLEGREGAFFICSFWLVEALVQTGRPQEAADLYAQLLEHKGEHGLFAEEFDTRSGEHLGNVPQAFSHVGLINAALSLGSVA